MLLLLPVQVDAGVDVGAVVVQCLAELQTTHKEASSLSGYDPAQWHRALKGEAPLDLWKLRHLQIAFWQKFLPRLASALIQQYFADLSLPYRMARADVEKHEAERKRA